MRPADDARAQVERALELCDDDPEQALASFDEIDRRYGESVDPATRREVARALNCKARGLWEYWWGSPELRLAIFDEIDRRYGTSVDPALRREVAEALTSKGALLGSYEVQRHEESLAVFDEAVSRFQDATDPHLVAEVAYAQLGRAEAFGELGRQEDAVAATDAVIELYDGEAALPFRELVADAHVKRGWFLHELGRDDEAIAAADHVIGCLRESTEPELCRCLGNARGLKGSVLDSLGREDEWLEELIADADAETARLGDSTEPLPAARATRALFSKANALGELYRYEEALATYDAAFERPAEPDDLDDPTIIPFYRPAFARAHRRKDRAVVLTALDRIDEATEALDEIFSDYIHDLEPGHRSVAHRALVRREILLHAPELELDAILVCWQARAVSPRLVIEAAFRTAAAGGGGPRTWEMAGLLQTTHRETVTALDALLPEVASENGGETLEEDYDGRGRLRLCRQVASGDLAPIPGAWVISLLDHELTGGDGRGIFLEVVGQLALEVDPSDELIEEVEVEITRRASRVVKRLADL